MRETDRIQQQRKQAFLGAAARMGLLKRVGGA